MYNVTQSNNFRNHYISNSTYPSQLPAINKHSLRSLTTAPDQRVAFALKSAIDHGRLDLESANENGAQLIASFVDPNTGQPSSATLSFSLSQEADLKLTSVNFGPHRQWLNGPQGLSVPLPGENPSHDDLLWNISQQSALAPHDGRINSRMQQATGAYDMLKDLEHSRAQIVATLRPLNSSLVDAFGSQSSRRNEYSHRLTQIDSQIREMELRLNMSVRGLRYRPINDADRAPYLALEHQHRDLFRSNNVRQVPEDAPMLKGIVDVDMDEYVAINADDMASGIQGIGTKGLGPCVAVSAEGKDMRGRPVLGMTHFSGIETATDTFAELDELMRSKGALGRVDFRLAGGMMMPKGSGLSEEEEEEEESGSLDNETNLLAMRHSYNIIGAKLHVCEGEQNPLTGEDLMTNAVLIPGRMFFRRNDLYES